MPGERWAVRPVPGPYASASSPRVAKAAASKNASLEITPNPVWNTQANLSAAPRVKAPAVAQRIVLRSFRLSPTDASRSDSRKVFIYEYSPYSEQPRCSGGDSRQPI